MIFVWLIAAIRKFVWLFRIPHPEQIAKINSARPCPVCGHPDSDLRCVVLSKAGPKPETKLPAETVVLCQHTCRLCGARYFEQPVAKVSPTTVLPSVPRNEVERMQDRQARLQGEES